MDSLFVAGAGLAAVAGLVTAAGFARQVLASDPGNERMQELMGDIREGAMAFLRRQYTVLSGFVVLVALLISAMSFHRVQTEKLDDLQSDKVRDALAKEFKVSSDKVSASFIGPSWGASVSKQALRLFRGEPEVQEHVAARLRPMTRLCINLHLDPFLSATTAR